MSKKPTVVCLCGSGRFKQAFEDAEYNETLAGKIVLTIGCNTKDVARCDELKHHKPMLDILHLRKIDLADEVLFLDVDGYMDESTRKELRYTQDCNNTNPMAQKVIRFLSQESEGIGG